MASYWDRYPTPEEALPTQFWVDSPLENTRVAPQGAKATDDAFHPLNNPPPKNSSKPNQSLPVRKQPSQPPKEKKQELRFFNVTDPKELKDRSQLRLNRQHVMHTFLDKERQKPSGQRDVRVDGAGAAMKRKRSRIQVQTTPFTASLIGGGGVTGRRDLPTPPESSCASDREAEHNNTPSKQKATEQKKVRQTDPTHDNNESQQLVNGLNGTWDNSRYNQANWEDIPFPASSSPDTTIGASLNPFNTWPTFSTTEINITALKYSCSRRFGSAGIATHWVPELLRARHAFLSTICISSAHDDIMTRARSPNPPPWLSTREGIERMRVRSEVIGLVNRSLEDEELRVADATIISVLHLLNSEVMGCDDRVMKCHQDGLHRMVRQRGGLEGLGVRGQLARILTITMYMISVLRESPPHGEFVAYASKHSDTTPIDVRARIPESPIYCRPSGFQTITPTNCPSIETWDLINTLRDLTKHFFLLHNPGQRHNHQTNHHQAGLVFLRDKIFTLPPSHSSHVHFPDLSSRNTYEALRLTALLYAHALTTLTPFSRASTHLTSGTATTSTGLWPPGISATESLHVQIRNALLKTDLSSVWGPLAGTLFWIVLVAGAGANPGPLAQEERVTVEEDGRKFLAAVSVRCSIVLSFEFGGDVLEMLRRFVRVEGVLNGGGQGQGVVDKDADGMVSPETWTQGLWTSEPGMGTFVDGQETAGPELLPVQQQEQDWTQMADFAWDFEGMG